MTDPRIYVASLSDYTAGRLIGRWIDLADADTMWAEIRTMLAEDASPGAEEWAIHDYEGFGDYKLSEYESIDQLGALAEFVDDTRLPFEAVLAYASNMGGLEYATRDAVEEAYRGEWDSVEDYAQELWHDIYEIPDFIEGYIDWEKVARDLHYGGDIWTHETSTYTVYVFENL